MNKKEALKVIKATEVDYTQKQMILRGLTILHKYDEGLNHNISFEHDQMWASDFESTVLQMSKEEVREMALCGWFESEEGRSHF